MALSTNDSTSTDLGLHHLHTQERGRRTTSENGPDWPAWADRSRPIPARFSRPFAPVGPLDILRFAPSNCINLTMSSSHPRRRVFSHEVRSFTLQSSGMFLCNTLVFTTFGSDFIMHLNPNETHHLLL
jgi:hypothetical protein